MAQRAVTTLGPVAGFFPRRPDAGGQAKLVPLARNIGDEVGAFLVGGYGAPVPQRVLEGVRTTVLHRVLPPLPAGPRLN